MFDQGNSKGYKQSHHYTWERWDGYLQTLDEATLDIKDNPTVNGKSQRIYDVNGQLKDAIDDAQGKSTTSHYLNSSHDGLRARQDSTGQTSYLNVAGKVIGDLHVDAKGKTELDIYSGFTPTGMPEVGFDAWKLMKNPLKEIQNAFQNGAKESTLPSVPQDNLGTWTLQMGDTLESIALQIYGDSSLWYLIADANGITDRNGQAGEKGSQLHCGQQLSIPPAASQHNNSSTKKVLNSHDLIGDTSATTPFPLPPPAPKKHGPWKILAVISIAVIATIATVMTAGALGILATGGSLSGAGGLSGIMAFGNSLLTSAVSSIATAATSFTAGFVGGMTSQVLGNLTGLQKGFDLTGALISGITAAATAVGATRFISDSKAFTKLADTMKNSTLFDIKGAATMMEQNIMSQTLNTSLKRQQHIDWLDIGIGAVTAGVAGGKLSEKYNSSLQKTFKSYASTVDSELQALATSATRAVTKGTHFNAVEVLIDNLGNAIANNFINNNSEKYNEKVRDVAVEEAKEVVVKKEKEAKLEGMDELLEGAMNGVIAESSKPEQKDVELSLDSSAYNAPRKGDVEFLKQKPLFQESWEKKLGDENLNATSLSLQNEKDKPQYPKTAIKNLSYTAPKLELEPGSKFDTIQSLVFSDEGGYSNHPNDRGGRTQMGITIATFKRFAESDLGIKPTIKNLKNLTKEQARFIYKKRFWNPLRVDEVVSMSVAHTFYDFHVNATRNAVRVMQRSVNEAGGSTISI